MKVVLEKFTRQSGFTLVEVIVALAILAIVGIGLLGGLTLASRTLLHADARDTARDLAQAQMESVQKQDYIASSSPAYTEITDLPTGYSIDINAQLIDANGNLSNNDIGIQKVTITVQQNGSSGYILEGRKVNW